MRATGNSASKRSRSAPSTRMPEAVRCRPNSGPSPRAAPVTRTRVKLRRSDLLQPDVVLGQRGGGGLRAHHVVELRELELVLEVAGASDQVKHRGHPPGEVLHAPDT